MKNLYICLLIAFLLSGCASGPKYHSVDMAKINNKTILAGMSIDKVTEIAGEPDSVKSISPAIVKAITGEQLKSYTLLKYGDFKIFLKDGIVSEIEKKKSTPIHQDHMASQRSQ